MEISGLPLYGRSKLELVEPPLEKAQMTFPIAPVLGGCYSLPGQRELPVDLDVLDLSTLICSQVLIL